MVFASRVGDPCHQFSCDLLFGHYRPGFDLDVDAGCLVVAGQQSTVLRSPPITPEAGETYGYDPVAALAGELCLRVAIRFSVSAAKRSPAAAVCPAI